MSTIFKPTYVALFALFILSVSFLWACSDKDEKNVEKSHWTAPLKKKNRINPVVNTIESVQRGQNLFADNCAECHGAGAEGDGPETKELETKPPNLKVMAGHHPDGDFAWKIETGKDDMPAWKDILTEQQIWDLVNFIQNLKNKN